jgi:hypothetical protein
MISFAAYPIEIPGEVYELIPPFVDYNSKVYIISIK